MKILARRRPIAWGLLLAALLFGGFALDAVVTGDARVLGRRNAGPKHILRASDPRAFASQVRFYGCVALIGVTLAFTRIVPVEDAWKRLGEQTRAAIHARGYDSKPAPAWIYPCVAAFLLLIVWIGWRTLYS